MAKLQVDLNESLEIKLSILRYLNENNLNIGEMATQLGVNYPHLCSILNGRRPWSERMKIAVYHWSSKEIDPWPRGRKVSA